MSNPTMIFSKVWVPINLDAATFSSLKFDRLVVNHVTIGANNLAWISGLSLSQVTTQLKKECQETIIHYYRPEIRTPQEILLFWVLYAPQSSGKIFYGSGNDYTSIQLVQHFLVFKTKILNVKMVDLNTTKEIVRINFGKLSFPAGDKYVMKFMVTSTNNVESEVLIASDTVIKSPSHAKITEYTEEQYNAMRREKLFKK